MRFFFCMRMSSAFGAGSVPNCSNSIFILLHILSFGKGKLIFVPIFLDIFVEFKTPFGCVKVSLQLLHMSSDLRPSSREDRSCSEIDSETTLWAESS